MYMELHQISSIMKTLWRHVYSLYIPDCIPQHGTLEKWPRPRGVSAVQYGSKCHVRAWTLIVSPIHSDVGRPVHVGIPVSWNTSVNLVWYLPVPISDC